MRFTKILIAVVVLIVTALMTTVLAQGLKGKIEIDGSSTVFPITEAVAEEFQDANPGVKVTIGVGLA